MAWKGPRRIASVESNYVCVLEFYLFTKELKAAHAMRFRFTFSDMRRSSSIHCMLSENKFMLIVRRLRSRLTS
jgi:hypothetical protein